MATNTPEAPTTKPGVMVPKDRIGCSFCGKALRLIGKMVSAELRPGIPQAFICDECVRLCMDKMGIAPPAEPQAEAENTRLRSEVDRLRTEAASHDARIAVLMKEALDLRERLAARDGVAVCGKCRSAPAVCIAWESLTSGAAVFRCRACCPVHNHVPPLPAGGQVR